MARMGMNKASLTRAAKQTADLRTTQPSDPRFLTSFTQEHKAILSNAQEVVFDFETTCLTPWDRPSAFAKSAKMGGDLTLHQYCQRTGATVNAAPRARILSLGLPDTRDVLVFDLDFLGKDDQRRLMRAALHNKVVVGHNVGFDLAWALSINPDIRPSSIIDTMILHRAILPQGETILRKRVASGGFTGPDKIAAETLLVQADKAAFSSAAGDGKKFGSLAAVCLMVGLPYPDKSYQKPQNWAVSVLTAGHYDYCAGDVTEPAIIARRLAALAAAGEGGGGFLQHEAILGGYDKMLTSRVLELIDQLPGGAAYSIAENAMPVLVQMQRNGLYMDDEATKDYIDAQKAAAEQIFAEKLQEIPALVPLKEDILSTGDSQALKEALDKLFPGGLPRTDKGGISLAADALKTAGLSEHPIIKSYSDIKNVMKRAAMSEDYLAMRDENGRLHPTVAMSTSTLRTSSQNPNLQNVPRDKAFRELFRANPASSTTMIAVDYSAVELRIAAALSVRAYRQVRQMVQGDAAGWKHMKWLRDDVLKSLQNGMPEVTHPNPANAMHQAQDAGALETPGLNDWKAYYADSFARPLKKVLDGGSKLTLRSAFQQKVDPHLATALYLLAIRGEYDLEGKNPVYYLASLPSEQQSSLKKQYKDARQAAKACIAEGQLVLTDKGLVPIEQVTTAHKLWDGCTWVSHAGVVYKGIKDVITYAGLTATPDHKCYVSDNQSIYFGDIANDRRRMVVTGNKDEPVPVGWHTHTGFFEPAHAGLQHVYDILDAGPLHRFTVQGLLVSNCNFGLLYGMGANTLHRYGIVSYGLDWTLEDAEVAYHSWHDLYPEITLWQIFTKLNGRYIDAVGNKKHDLGDGRKGYVELLDQRKVYQGFTLSGRPVVSSNITAAMNYQDQGTGAEIALAAIHALPERLKKMLVLFVHDELVFEVPESEAAALKQEVEAVMLDAADRVLGQWDVPCEVEGLVSKVWEH